LVPRVTSVSIQNRPATLQAAPLPTPPPPSGATSALAGSSVATANAKHVQLIGSAFQSRQSFDPSAGNVDALNAYLFLSDEPRGDGPVNLSTRLSARRSTVAPAPSLFRSRHNSCRPRRRRLLVTLTQLSRSSSISPCRRDFPREVGATRRSRPSPAGLCDDDKTLLSEASSTLNRQTRSTARRARSASGDVSKQHRRAAVARHFVNARLVIRHQNACHPVPPSRRHARSPTGYYAYIVKPDNKVERRVVDGSPHAGRQWPSLDKWPGRGERRRRRAINQPS